MNDVWSAGKFQLSSAFTRSFLSNDLFHFISFHFIYLFFLTRYGQTLQDARESGEWSCPKCRDVCNCSFCRKKKGLCATGILKHIALKAGYNSVMEYLGDA